MSVAWPEGSKRMSEYALYYASNGIAVFPLAPKSKIPLFSKERGGNGVYDATTDKTQIVRWWHEHPTANIGLACGTRFDVLDIDAHHGGEESLTKYPPVDVIIEAKTPNGGSHLFFNRSPVPLKNKVSVSTGLDVRSSGGYVVGAPSRIPEGRYTWKTAPLNGKPLPEVPQWLIDLAKREDDPIDLPDLFDGNLTDGQKHDSIIKSIYKMRKMGFDIDATKEIVAGMIGRISPDRLGDRPDRVIKKYTREVDDCFKKHLPDTKAFDIPVPPVAGLRGYSGVEREEVDWLWHPYIPMGGLTILVGDPGVGKSAWAYMLAASVSNGAGGAGFPEQDPGSVLLYCLEDDPSKVIRGRLEDCVADMDNVYDGTFDADTNPDGIGPPITLEKVNSIIEAVKRLPNVKLVVFDPIVEWFPADKSINTGNEVRSILREFRRLSEECRVAVLILGHTNKNSGGSLIYRPSGSIDFTAIVRSGIYAMFNPDDEHDRMLVHYKANWGPQGSAIHYTIDGEGVFNYLDPKSAASRAMDHEKINTLENAKSWLERALSDGPMDSEVLFEAGEKMGFSRDRLFEAKSEGFVFVKAYGTEGSKRFLWSTAPFV